jgi:hypothetical protein
MSLLDTNLLVQMARLPVDFRGSPQDLADTMVGNMRIVSPVGTNFFVVGDIEPTSNVGPWLKSGRSWWTWSESIKRYAPQDITESEKNWFWAGVDVPTSTPPLIWLETNASGRATGWKYFNATLNVWEFFAGPVLAGPGGVNGADRPTSPAEYQQFFDTDLSVLLWQERGKWRTVSGVPGDIKAVFFDTLAEALEHNPGWVYFGETGAASGFRGRIIMGATKDSGASPEAAYAPPNDVAARANKETFGETDGITMSTTSPVPLPPQVALWHLIKE